MCGLPRQVSEWEEAVKSEQDEKLDISADMVRQYKTMQSTMALRIHLLETNLSHMQVRVPNPSYLSVTSLRWSAGLYSLASNSHAS